jgi:cytochrome c peroxidase
MSKTPLLRALTVAVASTGFVACDGLPPTAAPEVSLAHGPPTAASNVTASSLEELGKLIFDDEDLSIHRNQSCASCHGEDWGTTGPDPAINAAGSVYEGSIPGRFGSRKPPTAQYATISPIFYQDRFGLWVGGNFWDGRATGEKLGNPAADQAQGPFLNPVEQALPDLACVVYRVSVSAYSGLYQSAWGSDIMTVAFPPNVETLCATEGAAVPLSQDDRDQVDREYDNIALSIAAYEASPELNSYSSKFDLTRGGGAKLTKEEQRGFALFRGKAKCANCHVMNGRDAAFTDFTYDNLGVPINPENPAFIADPTFRDLGLGAFLQNSGYPAAVYLPEMGKVKVPTVRNVDMRPTAGGTKAFTHNGYFKSLWSLVHFYNTRDVLPVCPGNYTEAQALAAGCWPAPEVADNVNRDELGDLRLSYQEEMAIVAFMKALTDGYVP